MLIVYAPLSDAPAGYDQPTMAEWPIIAGALLGVLIAAALWWAYFEIVALVAERRMRAAVLAVLVGFEAVRFRETRARIRTAP
jgi:hypothetical protein